MRRLEFDSPFSQIVLHISGSKLYTAAVVVDGTKMIILDTLESLVEAY